ncbi:ribonuclease P [Halovenus sp. WSH3]|uniref:Ribonuclease P protein component 1 n=1 Tax=Halovenus carboxidivorans TaxID=2692199 RepID=A0A6B0TBE8_9EURY|nr:ribonuclease P protein component 1 [Halovenus carboxidivorans]MXR52551.1 ribonuclease P [Halovenus carboxidivorans]
MNVRPTTLPRHELVGLPVEVRTASNPAFEGISGECVMETTQTLGIESEGRVRQVPKEAAEFAWTLPSGEVVATAGSRLVARPARRTEHRGDSKWR